MWKDGVWMDYSKIVGCITNIEDDSIRIDDSKFPITPLPVIGEEFLGTELGTLVCATEN